MGILSSSCNVTSAGTTCQFTVALCLTLQGTCSVWLYNSDTLATYSYVQAALNISDATRVNFVADTITASGITRTFCKSNYYAFRWTSGPGPYKKNITIKGIDNHKVETPQMIRVTVAGKVGDSEGNEYTLEGSQYYNTLYTVQHFALAQARIVFGRSGCTAGQELSEAGGTCYMTIKLTSTPVGGINITLVMNANRYAYTHTSAFCLNPTCTVLTYNKTVMFTETTWNVTQSLLMTGLDDYICENGLYYPFNVTLNHIQTKDSFWLKGMKVIMTDDPTLRSYAQYYVMDNQLKGINFLQYGSIIGNLGLVATDENGVHRQIELVLDQQPLHQVYVPITVSDARLGKTTTSLLIMGPNNYTSCIYYYYGVDNLVTDGTRRGNITMGPIYAQDAWYHDLVGRKVTYSFSVYDNDLVQVSPSTCTTDEGRKRQCLVNISIARNSWPTDPLYSTQYFEVSAFSWFPLVK